MVDQQDPDQRLGWIVAGVAFLAVRNGRRIAQQGFPTQIDEARPRRRLPLLVTHRTAPVAARQTAPDQGSVGREAHGPRGIQDQDRPHLIGRVGEPLHPLLQKLEVPAHHGQLQETVQGHIRNAFGRLLQLGQELRSIEVVVPDEVEGGQEEDRGDDAGSDLEMKAVNNV